MEGNAKVTNNAGILRKSNMITPFGKISEQERKDIEKQVSKNNNPLRKKLMELLSKARTESSAASAPEKQMKQMKQMSRISRTSSASNSKRGVRTV